MSSNSLQFRRGLSSAKKKAIRKQYDALLKAREKQHAKMVKPLNQIGKEARKQYGKLVTRAELKTAKDLSDRAQIDIAKLALPKKAAVSQAKIKSIKRKFRTDFEKLFKQREVIQRMRAKHRGEVQAGFEHFESSFTVADNLIADIPDVLSLPELQVTSFKPPYAFSEIFETGFSNHVTRNDSFVDTQTGFLLQDFNFRHSGGGSFNPVLTYDSHVAMGMRFTLPETGVLKVTAIMHNTLNVFFAVIKDNFGWSDGNVRISGSIFMDVLRPNNLQMSLKYSLAFLNLSSEGDDVKTTETDLQSITPYTVTLISTGAFAAGETVDILVGSQVHIRSSLDDMTCLIRPRIGWQVKEVFVEVI